MPTYEYRCPECLKQFELQQKMSDPALDICPHCHKGTPERVYSSSFCMQFKGDGFYQTDYADKEPPSCCQGNCHCSKKP